MPIEILMPALSPTMKEGNLAKWIKKEGDEVCSGDIIAEIETDKATMEVEAVDDGILGKILIDEGAENVPVNSLIALILEEGEDKSLLDNYKAEVKIESKKEEEKKNPPATKQEPQIAEQSMNQTTSRAFISPLAKNIARQNNVNIAQISGTGPNGRIIKDDVLVKLSSGQDDSKIIGRNADEYKAVQNSNIRKVIARRLLESKQKVPHFYLNAEISLDKLIDVRRQINQEAPIVADKPVYKISINDFIIKASALALKKVPEANSSWTDEAILLYNNIDVSVAVAIEGGLITPIVQNADQKTILNISAEMKSLISKAKKGTLSPEEFQGGGFSISNLGMFGIKSFNAIVNPPQSCILAVGASTKKPIIDGDEIVISEVMEASLSCDHRAVDGAVGATFLKELKNVIENPVLMLI